MRINILTLLCSLMKKRLPTHISVRIYLPQFQKLWLLRNPLLHSKFIRRSGRSWDSFLIQNKLWYLKKFNKQIYSHLNKWEKHWHIKYRLRLDLGLKWIVPSHVANHLKKSKNNTPANCPSITVQHLSNIWIS